jgi:hypothetical protein
MEIFFVQYTFGGKENIKETSIELCPWSKGTTTNTGHI